MKEETNETMAQTDPAKQRVGSQPAFGRTQNGLLRPAQGGPRGERQAPWFPLNGEAFFSELQTLQAPKDLSGSRRQSNFSWSSRRLLPSDGSQGAQWVFGGGRQPAL